MLPLDYFSVAQGLSRVTMYAPQRGHLNIYYYHLLRSMRVVIVYQRSVPMWLHSGLTCI
jgi:hypothetical protein